jgi:hypothetical protein
LDGTEGTWGGNLSATLPLVTASLYFPHYPGERLIACRNPFLAEEKALTRVALLQATEQELNLIVTATLREKRALKGADQIGLRVGRFLHSYMSG